MKKINKLDWVVKTLSAIFVIVLIQNASGVTSNIDSTNKWAWNDVAGWIDFYNIGSGAYVDANKVSRWGVWNNNTASYIALHCSALPPAATNDCTPSFGVTNVSGTLGNYAWSDEYGWISFYDNAPYAYGVTIDAIGNFQGFAWNDVIGWISFCGGLSTTNCPGAISYKVDTSWDPAAPPGTTDNYLESVTFDSGSADGFAINSIYWEGTLAAGSTIGFQLGVSTSTDFSSVEFRGRDGSVSSVYSAAGSGEAIPVKSLHHNPFESGYRYFRYRVYLDKASGSPVVTKVSVNWTK